MSQPTNDLYGNVVWSSIQYLFVVGILQAFCVLIQYYAFDTSGRRQTNRIRNNLFRAMLQCNVTYFDENQTGRLNSKLFENIEIVGKGIGLDLAQILRSLGKLASSICVAFYGSWQIALIMTYTIPLVIVTGKLFSKAITKETFNEFNAYSKAGHIAQEVFSSVRTVLSFNGAKFAHQQYTQKLEGCQRSSIKKGFVYGLFRGWMYFNLYLTYAVGFLCGLLLMNAKKNLVSLVDILVVVLAFARGIAAFRLVGIFIQSSAEVCGAATPAWDFLDNVEAGKSIETGIFEDNNKEKKTSINGNIRFDKVTFTYPTRPDVCVLQNMSLLARAGETTAIVGASGSGKSTLISLLLRFYESTSGQIVINGQSLSNYSVAELRQNIGVVNQEPTLFDTTIYENIRFGKKDASKIEIEEAARLANAHDFIMRLPEKYETVVGERGAQLSGGEKQRIVLARALVKQPQLLLFDEVTSALDRKNEKIVQEALDQACKDRTTIVIAHRLRTIQNANQIYVLDNGTLIEQGTHETLMVIDGGKYQAMFRAQQTKETVYDNDDEMVNKLPEKQLPTTNIDEHPETIFADAKLESLNYVESSVTSQRSIIWRLISMNKLQWIPILIGGLACTCIGAVEPTFAVALSFIINESDNNDFSSSHIDYYTAFGVAGQAFIRQLRSKAFASFLRQEVAFFDQGQNSSASICNRLSTDALAVHQIASNRFCLIIETAAVLSFGFILGLLFSWQLTLTIFAFVIIIGTSALGEVSIQIEVNSRIRDINRQSSSVIKNN
ncbi:unnamed protein product [Rotaria magnacalcarata]|uniref:Uncharacterized protein n=1 Tax=Rotaria magnacalcarata TaxID=392030 RepID=A0A820BGI5_9BILA|nr:unnamed protein product [Rotaria magnacalcarata]